MKRREFLISAAVLAAAPALPRQATGITFKHRDPCFTCRMTKYEQLKCRKRTCEQFSPARIKIDISGPPVAVTVSKLDE